jgi:HSP20 family protein
MQAPTAGLWRVERFTSNLKAGGLEMALAVRRTQTPTEPSTRWDPFGELEDLQLHLAQLLDSVASGPTANGGAWAPPVDIEEADDAWVVEAELPGVKRGDVNVDVRDSQLVISGEIKERERRGILRRRTRRVGQFEYRVTLPGEADAERIKADLHDGVLTVRVPKPEGSRPRQIQVKGE